MLDTRTTEWLSRLQANGPSAVAWVLGALIAVELARIAAALPSGPVKSPATVVEATAPQPEPGAPHPKPGVNVRAVVSAHLFGVAVADPSTQDPNDAPPSSANLLLAGIIATENPKKGIAIISDGGPSKVFAVGDNVSGASLYSVYLDHVILDRGGSLETLLLPRVFAGGSRAAPQRAADDVRTAQTIQNVKPNTSILAQVMRPVASFDSAAGQFRGFRAYPGRNRAMFTELGLKPGDLVTAINGQPLDDARHSEQVINRIQTAASVTVTIERGGNRQDISFNAADMAAKAPQGLEGEKPGGAGAAPPGDPSGIPMGAPVAAAAPESNTETSNE
jgi:general secretion pathway protein C